MKFGKVVTADRLPYCRTEHGKVVKTKYVQIIFGGRVAAYAPYKRGEKKSDVMRRIRAATQ